MGKKVIKGTLEVTQSVEVTHSVTSTGIHINEVPHVNTNISKSASVDQTASNITFNSRVRKTGEYSNSGSTSITYSGIEMTRTERLFVDGQYGEETTDTYSIQFPLESGTLALTSDFEYATTAEIEALFNS